MTKAAISGLVFVTFARADFNLKDWRFRLPVTVAPGNSISELAVTPDVFRHSSARLNDLRIVRNDAGEVPYLLKTLTGDMQQNEHSVTILNKAWTRGKGVQAVLDLHGNQEHNRLRIATDERNFKQTVMVETSDDSRHWSTVVSDAVIFDISRPETNIANLTVSYPTSTRRYVRVSIPGWTDPASLSSVWLDEYREREATRDSIGILKPFVNQGLVFDLGLSGQPCDRLVLQVAPGLFSRMVEISTSDDLKSWNGNTGSYISRTKEEEHLNIELRETWERYIKLTVFNNDNAPIDVIAAKASGIRRVVRFPSTQDGSYALYLGNSSANAPVYDFARVEDAKALAGVASVGKAEGNSRYQAPQAPYSERKPWVLNVVLGTAVAAMAFITYRFARKAASAG